MKAKRKRITFEINAPINSQVFLVGSFNDWNQKKHALKDKNNNGCFSISILLEKGVYEYKFIIDGQWHIDAENPNFASNSLGTLNSVLEVK